MQEGHIIIFLKRVSKRKRVLHHHRHKLRNTGRSDIPLLDFFFTTNALSTRALLTPHFSKSACPFFKKRPTSCSINSLCVRCVSVSVCRCVSVSVCRCVGVSKPCGTKAHSVSQKCVHVGQRHLRQRAPSWNQFNLNTPFESSRLRLSNAFFKKPFFKKPACDVVVVETRRSGEGRYHGGRTRDILEIMAPSWN